MMRVTWLAFTIIASLVTQSAIAQAPIETPRALFDDARNEVTRLRAMLQREEAEIARKFTETQRALQSGETVEQTGIQLGLARRYLAEHPLVRGMDTECQAAFSKLSDPQSRATAEGCVDRAPIGQPLPSGMDCARLTVEAGLTGLELEGYVSTDQDLALLSETYGVMVTRGVSVRPYPVCRALDTLGFTNTMEPTPEIQLLSRAKSVAIGESLAFEVITPKVPSFLYLVYLQSNDTVVNLLPKIGVMRTQHSPRTRLRFGDGIEDPRVFTASLPTGPEAIVAISARSPLDWLDSFESGPSGQFFGADNRLASRAEFLDRLDGALKDFKERPNGNREISYDLLYLVITK